jgi:hypothetical protein
MILALAVNPVQRYRNQYQIDSGRYWPMGTATHGFQIQLRQNGPKKPYRGAIPTLASTRFFLWKQRAVSRGGG